MKPFANDSGANFESAADPAHASAFNKRGATDAGIGRETVPRGSREAGARGHETDASDAADAARGCAEETAGKEEIEVTEEMIWAGLESLYSFDLLEDDKADIVRNVFLTMRARELARLSGLIDPASAPLQSPYRYPIGVSANQRA
jgi:hypothetical protein